MIPYPIPLKFKQIVAELAAKTSPLSPTLTLRRSMKSKVSREDTEFCLHPTYGNHKYATLAKNPKSGFTFDLKRVVGLRSTVERCWIASLTYTRSTEDAKICGLAERAEKMVEGNANFISEDQWFKNFKVNKESIYAAKSKLSKNSSDVNIMIGLKDIEDRFIVEMIEEYKEIAKNKVGTVPELLANRIADNADVKEFKENDAKFGKLMKDEYPLVRDCSYSNSKKEWPFYMNAKYKARKGK